MSTRPLVSTSALRVATATVNVYRAMFTLIGDNIQYQPLFIVPTQLADPPSPKFIFSKTSSKEIYHKYVLYKIITYTKNNKWNIIFYNFDLISFLFLAGGLKAPAEWKFPFQLTMQPNHQQMYHF